MYNHKKTTALLLLYLVFIGTAIFITIVSTPGILNQSFMRRFSSIFGVVTLSLLVVQQILAVRIPTLEKGVGLNKLMLFHHLNARFIVFFVLAHPALIFYNANLAGMSPLLLAQAYGVGYWLGAFALLLVLIIGFTAVAYAKIGLRYDQWRKIHTASYLILIFGFAHSFMLSPSILTRGLLFYWWVFLAVLSVSAFIYRYAIRLYNFKDSFYEVAGIENNTLDVTNVYLKPLAQKLKYFPGQFSFLKFYSSAATTEEHPFTISSSPKDDLLCFSIKSSGDFTANMPNLNIGDKVKVEGPYGVFSVYGMPGPFVFIAGGIGITPFRSMLRYMHQIQNSADALVTSAKKVAVFGVTLIYANKDHENIAFYDELNKIQSENSWLKIVHVLSGTKSAESEKVSASFYNGHVSEDILKKEISNLAGSLFFVCGPPPMMHSVNKILGGLGVSKSKVFMEKFSL